MKKYRDRHRIIHEMLSILPQGRTHLMYKTCLSFYQLNEYTDYLLKHSLIEFQWGQYRLSERGKRYLETLNELLELQQ